MKTKEHKTSEIPTTEMNCWGYPNDNWVFVGYTKKDETAWWVKA